MQYLWKANELANDTVDTDVDTVATMKTRGLKRTIRVLLGLLQILSGPLSDGLKTNEN